MEHVKIGLTGNDLIFQTMTLVSGAYFTMPTVVYIQFQLSYKSRSYLKIDRNGYVYEVNLLGG